MKRWDNVMPLISYWMWKWFKVGSKMRIQIVQTTVLKLMCFNWMYVGWVVFQYMLLCDCEPLTWVPLQFTYQRTCMQSTLFLPKTFCLGGKKIQCVTANGTSFQFLWKFLWECNPWSSRILFPTVISPLSSGLDASKDLGWDHLGTSGPIVAEHQMTKAKASKRLWYCRHW